MTSRSPSPTTRQGSHVGSRVIPAKISFIVGGAWNLIDTHNACACVCDQTSTVRSLRMSSMSRIYPESEISVLNIGVGYLI